MNYNIDISGVVLKTERLILREWTYSDLNDFYEYASTPGVGEMAGWPHHKNIEESKTILDRFIKNKNQFCIEYNGKAIGSLGIELYNEEKLKELDKLKAREIGFVLSKDYWGMGLMPEAVKCVINYLFNVVGLDVLVCGHFEFNHQSERVQEKCGFKHYKLGINDDGPNVWISLLYNNK